MNQTIAQGIKEKRHLSFTYDGYPRVVEPHAHGVTSTGKESLRCYQVRGSGKDPNGSPWHLMTVSKMMNLTVTEEYFPGPRPEYKKGDRHLSPIYCEL
jgi:hypothetical protein